MEPSKILLLTGVAVVLLFIMFTAFRGAILGKDGVMDRKDVTWPIYTLFVGISLFTNVSDFKFACLVAGSVGVELITSILAVWKLKQDEDRTEAN